MNRHSKFIGVFLLIGLLCPSFAYADGFNFRKPSPLFHKGEIFVRTATGDVAIGVGPDTYVLSADSTTATGLRWGTLGASGSGTVTNSGTLTSNAVIIGNGTTVIAAITADTSTSHFLGSTATSPAFRQILTADVTGTQPVATGGTGITAGTSGGVPYFINAGLMASSAALDANAVVIGGGAGATPATITADTTAGHFLSSTTGAPAFRQLLTGDTVGTLPVARGGTGLTGGTSGGVAYFINGGRIGTSATLTQYGVVLGGGSGNAPTVTTADTVVTHALMATATSPAFRQILTTDVVGTYPAATAAPGGSTTQIQYNNGGVLSGATLFTTDGTRVALGLNTAALISMDVTGSFRTTPFVLTDGATINIDVSRSNQFLVILGGNRTLANFTNATIGQRIVICVSQDATGGRKLGFGTAYKFGTDVPSYDSSTTAGTKDYIAMFFGNPLSADIVGVSKGYR